MKHNLTGIDPQVWSNPRAKVYKKSTNAFSLNTSVSEGFDRRVSTVIINQGNQGKQENFYFPFYWTIALPRGLVKILRLRHTSYLPILVHRRII